MVTSRSPRGHHPDDIPEGFRLFAERREGQKRFPAEGLRSRGGRLHAQGSRGREFPRSLSLATAFPISSKLPVSSRISSVIWKRSPSALPYRERHSTCSPVPPPRTPPIAAAAERRAAVFFRSISSMADACAPPGPIVFSPAAGRRSIICPPAIPEAPAGRAKIAQARTAFDGSLP